MRIFLIRIYPWKKAFSKYEVTEGETKMLEILAQSLLIATRFGHADRHGPQTSHELRQDMLLHERRLRDARLYDDGIRTARWG
jgi:hypothetical protein